MSGQFSGVRRHPPLKLGQKEIEKERTSALTIFTEKINESKLLEGSQLVPEKGGSGTILKLGKIKKKKLTRKLAQD